MALVIEKKEINDWLSQLKKRFQVADIRKEILPPKKLFFPPKEKIFNFDKETEELNIPALKEKKDLIVFGLGLEDLEAITQLDEIMKKPQSDFFYWRRREKATIIGLVDEPISVSPGGDIILEKINDHQHQCLFITEKGKRLGQSKFFKNIEKPRIENYKINPNPIKGMLLDSELLAEAVAWSWPNHKIWDELAKRCLGCGICTYVCPLCHCFSTEDSVSLDDKECVRCRQWDACTLPGFAKVAGGHNFHKTIKERYYNWYYHKFVRAYKEYGKAQCVACGRCYRYCPAGIGIKDVLTEILKDYKKEKGITR